MATRNDLVIIKQARTGAAAAQLALGTRYFFGGSSLPQSTETAFYWLERAARQGLQDAWLMIGRYVPYESLSTMARPYEAAGWYEKAFDSGIFKAGLVFARLVLEHSRHFSLSVKKKAIDTLRKLADADNHEAQWLLAQQIQQVDVRQNADSEVATLVDAPMKKFEDQWVRQAARAGVEGARYSLLEKAWCQGDFTAYEENAYSVVDKLLLRHEAALAQLRSDAQARPVVSLEGQEIELLLRYSQLLMMQDMFDLAKAQKLLELAALTGSPQAGFELGMLHARIDQHGNRTFPDHGIANYKMAIPWLLVGARGGIGTAWHALSIVYTKSEFSQRDLPTSRRYLERAAEMGLVAAQFEHAQNTWRNRRDNALSDVRALYWWSKAAEQGHEEAKEILFGFSVRSNKDAWASKAAQQITNKLRAAHPFLTARIELAAAFGLTRPEALLVDVRDADHGHCLVVDICKYYGRSKRRLILIETEEQRQKVNLVARLFSDIDSNFEGPEGNYRQRQYKLKSVFSDVE